MGTTTRAWYTLDFKLEALRLENVDKTVLEHSKVCNAVMPCVSVWPKPAEVTVDGRVGAG